MTVIGLAVAVLVMMTVMVPVISSELQHTETVTKTLENNYGRYSIVEDFQIVRSDGIPLLTSSELYPDPTNYGTSSNNNFIVLDNAVMARYGNSWYLFYVEDGERKQTTINQSETITFSNGVLSFLSHNIPCTMAFLLDPDGYWAFTTLLTDAIWNKNPVYNFEYAAANSGVVVWSGKEYHVNFWMDNTSVVTDTYVPNADNIGEIPLGNGTGYALIGSMYKWFMPYEYTYTETVESEGTIFTLIQIIPLLAILGLILIPVGLFVRRSAR